MKSVLVLLILLLFTVSCQAQETELFLSAKVTPAAEMVGRVSVSITYPMNFTYLDTTVVDSGIHFNKTIYAAHDKTATRTVVLGFASAYGWKPGTFARVRFVRTGPVKYSTVTGNPLSEVFKLVDIKAANPAGVAFTEGSYSVSVSKSNWR